MQRYQIFNNIHKGLRAALYQTALKLQQTDFLIEEEAEEATNKVREVIMLFDTHAGKEDRFILPAIAAYEPSVVDLIELEHEKDLQLSRQLNQLVSQYSTAASFDEKLATGAALTIAFVEFMVFNLQHMAKEEDLLNTILLRYYTDEELVDISSRIVAATPAWFNEFYSAWMLRGLNTREMINWMKVVEKNAPAMVFQDLYNASKRELSPSRFYRIQRAMAEGEVLA
jgi:hypothetical protein